MARSARSRPARTLLVLVGLLAVLYGVITAGAMWDKAQWTPKLALDLEGGTEVVLSPTPTNGQKTVDPTAVDESVNIIRQRVNGSGISEAEVTRQGQGADTRIVVSLPGTPDQGTIDLVEKSAQLQFRAVLTVADGALPRPSATPTGAAGTPAPTASGSKGSTPAPSSSAKPSSSVPAAKPGPTNSTSGMNVPDALRAAPTPSPTGGATGSPTGATGAAGAAGSPRTPAAKPTDASDPNWVTPQLEQQFAALNCADSKVVQQLRQQQQPAAGQPYITCSPDGSAKYLLGPAELVGTDVSGATAAVGATSQGLSTGEWQVNLTFSSAGAKKFGDVTTRLVALPQPRNQFAIVLDNLVISAPRTDGAITTGSAEITGSFTQESATALANQLKYGALPVSFTVQTSNQISATLGSEQLRRGLLAGLIGLGLVVLYSLLQYRALGLVTVASLAIAATITYGLVVLLGWRQGYRLSLPGVAGLIVSIGITADSFIVFFERVRDEVRDGRSLQAGVEAAWSRARRTILASDGVSFLAAIVLYVLAIGSVRGFAFTLGLTTIVDVVVVFLFTKPTVTLLARTRFFGGGHRLSGFDAAHLGREVAYAGRGRVRTRPARPAGATAASVPAKSAAPAGERRLTIAERRAERERAALAEREETPPGEDPLVPHTTTSGRES